MFTHTGWTAGLAAIVLAGAGQVTWAAAGESESQSLKAIPTAIELADVPRDDSEPPGTALPVRGEDRAESKFDDQQVEAAQQNAANQPVSSAIQVIGGVQRPAGVTPTLLSSFDALHAGQCCRRTGYAATVPPDPDIAAGRNYLIVVVNTTFEIYDLHGKSLTGPIQLATFFDPTRGGTNPGAGKPTPGCTAYALFAGAQYGAVFDPDVVYDEANDRFVIGVDGNGDSYCVAASRSGNPTRAWNRYGFSTPRGEFADFPHMGVGTEAIFLGSNQFTDFDDFFEFAGGRVFAMNKSEMYAGSPLTVVTRRLRDRRSPSGDKLDGTPQPMQLHGLPFPAASTAHYIMGEFFDGKSHAVYAWSDPFGRNRFVHLGDVDLAAASGVPCEDYSCFPVPWPQKGSPEIMQANDYRGEETEWRNGLLWTTQGISCNPRKRTTDCVRWAQIDPADVRPGRLRRNGTLISGTGGVIQAGVFGSTGHYRTFPSLAANSCNDMAVGYSRGGADEFPSLFVAGRRASDPLGTVGGERLLIRSKVPYSSFQDNEGYYPERWGDYSGMTIAPDGKTFWYVGEYARARTPNPFANWGTYVGSFRIPGC